MPLPPPNLDDRRWLDITQEAIPLIPVYAPQWTDFNISDPGITLMEMFSWLTESMVYQLNHVPNRFIWRFLYFIGYPKRGPIPACTVLAFEPLPPGPPFEVPAGTQFSANTTLFATTRAIDLAQVTLTALQVDPGTGVLQDYSRDLADGLPVTALGTDAAVGAALYFGFSAIPTGSPIALWMWFVGPGNTFADRERIIREAVAQKAACTPVQPGWRCGSTPATSPDCDFTIGVVPPHHSARIVWEVFSAGTWAELTPIAMPARPTVGQVVDDTRSLTLDGLVEVNLPSSVTTTALGTVAEPLYYLRARLANGAYDAPVVLERSQPNAVAVVQWIPLWQQLELTTAIAPPAPGSQISLQFTVSPNLTIQTLNLQSPPAVGTPGFTFLNYVPPPAGANGFITLEFAIAGIGTAVPGQQVYIPGAPVVSRCFRLHTHDGTNWIEWRRVADFDASNRTDLAYTLDQTTGLITCGDGQHGQVFPQGSVIVVTGFSTDADEGNLAAKQIWSLAATPVNGVLLASLAPADQALLSETVSNPVPAAGGLPAAPLTELEGEAAEVVSAHERLLELAESAQQTTVDQIPKSEVLALPAPSQAVNLLDTERFALTVPGTIVARARAWADTDPALPGIHATGVVTVVILPAMPVAQPEPSPGLLAAVKQYLHQRRIICTRIETAAPTYLVITVTASVTALAGASTTAVQNAILTALANFLNPLSGGPAGLGWPFGRSVYNAEILELIASVAGVDYVNSMTMTADNGTPRCGDIPLCPAWLVSSGAHQIEVLSS